MQNVRRIKDMVYIISTEKVKENTNTFKQGFNGDWFYNCIYNFVSCTGNITHYDFKIVATNDLTLTMGGVQALTTEELIMLDNAAEEVIITVDTTIHPNKYYFSLSEYSTNKIKAEEIVRSLILDKTKPLEAVSFSGSQVIACMFKLLDWYKTKTK